MKKIGVKYFLSTSNYYQNNFWWSICTNRCRFLFYNFWDVKRIKTFYELKTKLGLTLNGWLPCPPAMLKPKPLESRIKVVCTIIFLVSTLLLIGGNGGGVTWYVSGLLAITTGSGFGLASKRVTSRDICKRSHGQLITLEDLNWCKTNLQHQRLTASFQNLHGLVMGNVLDVYAVHLQHFVSDFESGQIGRSSLRYSGDEDTFIVAFKWSRTSTSSNRQTQSSIWSFDSDLVFFFTNFYSWFAIYGLTTWNYNRKIVFKTITFNNSKHYFKI